MGAKAGSAHPHRGLSRLAYLLAGASLLWLLAVVPARLAFPWPLEWMEGGVQEHVARLLNGGPLYLPPRAAFTPYVYMPGAYLVMAAPAALFGAGLPVLRAVSVVAFAAVLLSLYRIARAHAHRAYAGAFAVAWFALGFGYTGAFMDLARVDAIWMACVCAGAERLVADKPRAGLAWLAGAVLVKQQALLLLVGAGAWLLLRRQPVRWRVVVAPTASVAAVVAAWAWLSDGWFLRYTFSLPAAHGLSPGLLVSFVFIDVGLYLPVLALIAARAVSRRFSRPGVLDLLVLLALVMGALGRAHPGGHDNVRLPMFALLCALAAGELARSARMAGPRLRLMLGLGALVQAAILFQPAALHRPSPASARGFEALATAARRCGGDGPATTAAPDFGPPLGTVGAHTMALSDVYLAGDRELNGMLDADVARFFAAGPAEVVIVGEAFPALTRAVAEHYSLCTTMPAPPMTTGYQPPRQRLFARPGGVL